MSDDPATRELIRRADRAQHVLVGIGAVLAIVLVAVCLTLVLLVMAGDPRGTEQRIKGTGEADAWCATRAATIPAYLSCIRRIESRLESP